MKQIEDLLDARFRSIDYDLYPELKTDDREVSSPDDESRHYVYQNLGLVITTAIKSGLVVSLAVFSDDNECGYKEFFGKLPRGIKFDMSSREIELKLGDPAVVVEPSFDPLLGEQTKPSMRYDYDKYSLYVEFKKDKTKIVSLTMLSHNYWRLLGYE